MLKPFNVRKVTGSIAAERFASIFYNLIRDGTRIPYIHDSIRTVVFNRLSSVNQLNITNIVHTHVKSTKR